MNNEFVTLLLDIKQIPEPEKPQAVVIATIRNSHGEKQGIGAAVNNKRDAAYDPQALIDMATDQAISQAYSFGKAERQVPAQKRPKDTPQTANTSATSNKNKFTHKTQPGTISDKQFTMLEKMAQERNQSFADMSEQMFNAKPADLSSQQAQDLYDHLKNIKKEA